MKSFGYYEGKISFLPTYKYSDDGSNVICCDSKEHIPSWTDRILYKINEDKFKKVENDENENEKDENCISEDSKEENNNESDEYEDDEEENFDTNKEKKEKSIEATFKLKQYNSMQNIVFSDHKPVYAYFNVNIK